MMTTWSWGIRISKKTSACVSMYIYKKKRETEASLMIYYTSLPPQRVLVIEKPTTFAVLNQIRRHFHSIVKGEILRVMVVYSASSCRSPDVAETISDLIMAHGFSKDVCSTRYTSLVRDFLKFRAPPALS